QKLLPPPRHSNRYATLNPRPAEGFWRGPVCNWRTFPKAVVRAWAVGGPQGDGAARGHLAPGGPPLRPCARGQSPRNGTVERRSIARRCSDPRPGLLVEVLLIFEEAVHFRLCLILGATVALLNLAGEDLRISVNLIQIVVSELAPLLPDPALQLFPLS